MYTLCGLQPMEQQRASNTTKGRRECSPADEKHLVDAFKCQADRDVKDSDQQALLSKQQSSPFWQMRGTHLSRSLSRSFSLQDVFYDEVPADGGRSGRLKKKWAWAAAAAVLMLAVLTCSLRGLLPAAKQHSAPGVSQYLRGIAAWYEGSQPGAAHMVLSLEATYHACAKQVILPAVQMPKQLPMIPAWQPAGLYPPDPLDELALNCSTLRDTKACAAAAGASNLYEGDLPPLDPDDLEAHSMVLQDGQVLSADAAIEPLQDLASLELNCEEDPAACAAVAEYSNSYTDGATAVDAGVAAEAAAYLLHQAQATNGWDAIIEDQSLSVAESEPQEEQQPAPNSYEGSEQQWLQRRIAEEAGPQYIDATALELDCSAEQDDSDTAAECERSRAVNRYEVAPPTTQKGCQHDASIQYQQTDHSFRTVGYDVPCVDWEQQLQAGKSGDAGGSAIHKADCTCGRSHSTDLQGDAEQQALLDGADKTALSAQRLQALQLQLQQAVMLGRVTGYDVPAVDDQQELLSHFAKQQAELEPAAAVPRDELQQARMYYKQPCNDPAARQQFKNKFNSPMYRMYYKNPANAPVLLAEQDSKQVSPPVSSSNTVFTAASILAERLTSTACASVFAALAAVAAGSWYVSAHGYRSKPRYQRIPTVEEDPAAEEEAGRSSSPTIECSPPCNNTFLAAGAGTSAAAALGAPALSCLPNPSLYTCASTIHDGTFDVGLGAPLEVAAGALEQCRSSLLDDAPEPGLDSPHGNRCSTPMMKK